MPSIKDRTVNIDDARPVAETPTAFDKAVTAPPIIGKPFGPTGTPVPRRGLPPNEYLLDSTIEDANPDSPYFQRTKFASAIAEADAPAQLVVGTPVIPTPSFEGAALPVGGILVTESPYKAAPSGLYSLVSVAFNRVLSDTLFGYVNIWVKGYHGSSVPELVASGTTSPISFLLETTGETITVYASTVSISGVPNIVESSPFQTVLLDGVTSAPPAPTITQTLVGTPVGYQFTFTQLGGILADIIAGYNIYRNTSNTTVGATVIRFIPQSALNSGSFVFQDVLNDAVVYYYWVSAVNTSGLESALTSAQSGAVVGSTGSVPPALSGAFTYVSDSTSITWSWASLVIYRADGTTTAVTNGSQAITGLGGSTTYYFYPYWDETTSAIGWVSGGTGTPAYAFAARSLTAAQTQSLRNHIALSQGAMTAATTGGGGGGGGGGGSACIQIGTLVKTKERGVVLAESCSVNEHLWSKNGWTKIIFLHILSNTLWLRLSFSSGETITVTPSHVFPLADGLEKRAEQICLSDVFVGTEQNVLLKKIEVIEMLSYKVLIGCVPEHTFYAGEKSPSILVHNVILK